MTKDELYKILETVSTKRWRRTISSNKMYMDAVLAWYPGIDNKEATFLFVHHMDGPPSCPMCSKQVGFLGNRYPETCSYQCSNAKRKQDGTLAASLQKAKETMLEKYGVDNMNKLASTTTKRHETLIAKYGSLTTDNHYSKRQECWDTLNKKGRETLMAEHGVSSPSQLPGFKEQIKNTMIARYGVQSKALLPERIKKREESLLERLNQITNDKIQILSIVPPNLDKGEVLNRYETSCSCGSNEMISSETFKYRIKMADTPCKTCSGLTTCRSLKEIQVYDFLKEWVSDLEFSDRTLIAPYEVDMVSHTHKIAVEFCGLFWHSNELVDSNYHKMKMDLVNGEGYKLITIFEDEWDQRNEVTKARLANAFKAGPTKSIGARKCKIVTVDSKIARQFCEDHHIQGYANASIKLGLEYEDTLVSLMTFSKPSLAKGFKGDTTGIWELSRFCSNTNVVGAASKLFAAFVKSQDPIQVFSYADLRWGNGSVYSHMSFTFSHNSKPNYWYTDKALRIHRFVLRKNKDDDQSLTEWENRKAQGYRRIWDCGHAKWIWRKSP